MALNRRTFLLATGTTIAGAAVAVPAHARELAWETALPANSFASYSALESGWNYLYPWGSDHNGTARMYASRTDHNHVYLESGGVLVLKGSRITWDEGKSNKDPYLPIHYHAGAIHSKLQVVVNDQFPAVGGEGRVPGAFRRAAPGRRSG